jgi:ADP-heptose:LPS heptosyltransferase
VAQALGLADHPRTALIATTPAEAKWLADQMRSLPRPIMAIHAGAGWVTKRWPIEKFAEIARRFTGSVVVIGAASERQSGATLIASLANTPKPALNLAGQTTLKQLTALLREVDLLVTNDSGPMHLAAAVGTPVVGIFTCTSPDLSGPEGAMHELLSTMVPCAAGYHKTCPHGGSSHLACLAELSVERVWSAVVRILDRRHSTARPA